jgi:hypothetical protein
VEETGEIPGVVDRRSATQGVTQGATQGATLRVDVADGDHRGG